MGREIGYCRACGVRVQAADGQGILFEGGLYCSGCLPGGAFDPRPLPAARPVTPRPLPRVRQTTQRTRRRKPSALIGAAALLAVVLAAVAWAAVPAQTYPEALRPRPERIVAPPPPKPLPEEAKTFPEGLPPKAQSFPEGIPLPALEAEAEGLSREFEETALGLAGEGRLDGALRKIDAFPARLRETRAWRSLEALRRSLEARR